MAVDLESGESRKDSRVWRKLEEEEGAGDGVERKGERSEGEKVGEGEEKEERRDLKCWKL